MGDLQKLIGQRLVAARITEDQIQLFFESGYVLAELVSDYDGGYMNTEVKTDGPELVVAREDEDMDHLDEPPYAMYSRGHRG